MRLEVRLKAEELPGVSLSPINESKESVDIPLYQLRSCGKRLIEVKSHQSRGCCSISLFLSMEGLFYKVHVLEIQIVGGRTEFAKIC